MLFCSNSGYGTRAVTAHFRGHERCVCACAEQVQPAAQCSPWSTASGYACASRCSRFRRHERCTIRICPCRVASLVLQLHSGRLLLPSSLGTAVLVAHGSKRGKKRVCGSRTTRKQTPKSAESAPRPNNASAAPGRSARGRGVGAAALRGRPAPGATARAPCSHRRVAERGNWTMWGRGRINCQPRASRREFCCRAAFGSFVRVPCPKVIASNDRSSPCPASTPRFRRDISSRVAP